MGFAFMHNIMHILHFMDADSLMLIHAKCQMHTMPETPQFSSFQPRKITLFILLASSQYYKVYCAPPQILNSQWTLTFKLSYIENYIFSTCI